MKAPCTYLRIYFLGILSVMVFTTWEAVSCGQGDSRNPLYFSFWIVSSVTNIILICCSSSFTWGIAGVGRLTLIAQTISAVLTMLLLYAYQRRIPGKAEALSAFTSICFYEIVRLGLPAVCRMPSFPSNVIVQSNINAFGSLAQAGCGPTPRSTALPYFRL